MNIKHNEVVEKNLRLMKNEEIIQKNSNIQPKKNSDIQVSF